ncbi:hypothetical protein [Streptomyces wedmorensis]|uniref:hypothetical protein n=1 Tax=Streptomyces wedmorensis TaxID=43759 RepID=UPI0037A1A190
MQAEPLKGIGTEADGDGAVPVAIRAHTAHQVDLDLVVGEGVPVDTAVPQSNRRQVAWLRVAGDVLEAEEGHPSGRLIAHGDILPQRASRPLDPFPSRSPA